MSTWGTWLWNRYAGGAVRRWEYAYSFSEELLQNVCGASAARALAGRTAGTLYPRARSWFLGANVPGKPVRFRPHPGGSDRCAIIAQGGYSGFEVREAVGGDSGSGTVGGSRVPVSS